MTFLPVPLADGPFGTQNDKLPHRVPSTVLLMLRFADSILQDEDCEGAGKDCEGAGKDCEGAGKDWDGS